MKLVALLLVSLIVVACDDATRAADPVWGKEACQSCAMLLSDPRFAAQLATEDGARVLFDDPGCMATWIAEGRGKVRRAWVRTAAGTWVDARTARYARGQPSPMGFGFAVDEHGDAEWADVELAAGARARKGEPR
jgi:hypothetical protein